MAKLPKTWSFAPLWKTISYSGAGAITDRDLRKKIILTNRLGVISGLPILLYVPLDLTKPIYWVVMVLAALLSGLAAWLNHFGHYNLSRLAVILAPQIATTSSCYLLMAATDQVDYLAKFTITTTFILPLVIISIRERILMGLGVSIVLANYFSSHWVGTALLANLYPPTYLNLTIFQYIAPVVNFSMFFLGFAYLQRLNLAAEAHVGSLLGEAQALNEEMSQINDSLTQNQRKLDRINRNLTKIVRKRTKELSDRNRKLESYAHFLAHQVRAPLARILGLVLVLKMTDHQNLAEVLFCVEKINDSALELDQIVRQFNQQLDDDSGPKRLPPPPLDALRQPISK